MNAAEIERQSVRALAAAFLVAPPTGGDAPPNPHYKSRPGLEQTRALTKCLYPVLDSNLEPKTLGQISCPATSVANSSSEALSFLKAAYDEDTILNLAGTCVETLPNPAAHGRLHLYQIPLRSRSWNHIQPSQAMSPNTSANSLSPTSPCGRDDETRESVLEPSTWPMLCAFACPCFA